MKDLLKLLESNFEQIDERIFAEWLNEDQKEPLSIKGYFKAMSWLDEDCKSLMNDDRVTLVIDDRALIVEVKQLNNNKSNGFVRFLREY